VIPAILAAPIAESVVGSVIGSVGGTLSSLFSSPSSSSTSAASFAPMLRQAATQAHAAALNSPMGTMTSTDLAGLSGSDLHTWMTSTARGTPSPESSRAAPRPAAASA
jgi:hypothetical protein